MQVRVSYTASRFIFSADSGIDETRRLAAFFGTRCLNLLYLLGSEFSRHQGVCVLGSEFSRRPEDLIFLGS